MSKVDRHDLDRLVSGEHHDPHAILGVHQSEGEHGRVYVVRALRPGATKVALLIGAARRVMRRIHDGGVFEISTVQRIDDYHLEAYYESNPSPAITNDPYHWLPTVGTFDQYLIREGRHEQLWKVLGAHPRVFQTPNGDVTGTSFAVWAPNARGVRLAGDFNFWDSAGLPMRSLGACGVWEVFVPGVGVGARYKFHILSPEGHWREKADPMAFSTEPPPATGSVVTASDFAWSDEDWIADREAHSAATSPMSIYEVHLGSWRKGLSYRELAEQLVQYVIDLGFTHVEFLPVAEHPFGGSWGYQVTSYYAPTARFGSPDDFRYLVDQLHAAGIGVIVDWVPAHFPSDEWALARFDGTPLYEHADPQRGAHPDWGTLIFDYGRPEVRNFLVANALYWFDEFHVDALRVDAVASMLYLDYSREDGEWSPNALGGRENLDAVRFLQETTATVHKHFPGAQMIAEESTSWPGVTAPTEKSGLNFNFKQNLGWMHDTLEYLRHDPLYRNYHHNQLSFPMVYAYSERYILPLSHDEVVHGKGSLLSKMPGDRWQQLANLRCLFAYMWAHPGKQLLFMGGEFAQEGEWSEEHSLDWYVAENLDHYGMQQLVRDLNSAYKELPALWQQDDSPAGFSWIEANDTNRNTFSFVRWAVDGSPLVCVANFAGHPHENYRLGLPQAGEWREVINTDAKTYGGSDVGNLGTIIADGEGWHYQPHSATVRVPPLGALWLAPVASRSLR